MAFCIMRTEKIKSRVSLVRRLQHNTRERMPPNADEKRTPDNWTAGGNVAAAMKRYDTLLPDKVRKNAVHAVEIVFTSTDGAGGVKYLNDADKWAMELFGKENVLHIAHHKDETAIHSHILVMPIHDGKLNSRYFIGGSRDRLTELQTDFYEKVGKKHGLERGKPRAETKARHTAHTLEPLVEKYRTFDRARETTLEGWELPKTKILETAASYRERIAPEVMGKIERAFKQEKTASQREAEAIKKRQEAGREIEALKNREKDVARIEEIKNQRCAELYSAINKLDGKWGSVEQAKEFIRQKEALEKRRIAQEQTRQQTQQKPAPRRYAGYER